MNASTINTVKITIAPDDLTHFNKHGHMHIILNNIHCEITDETPIQLTALYASPAVAHAYCTRARPLSDLSSETRNNLTKYINHGPSTTVYTLELLRDS